MTRGHQRFGHGAAALRWAGLSLLLGLAGCADLMWWWPGQPDAAVGEAAEDDYTLGKAHLAAGRAGLAARHFQAALDRAPDTPDSLDALNGLAAAYTALGRHDLAARHYGRALVLDSEAAGTLNNIGYSYLQQGRFDLAVAFLRDAHRRDEDQPIILENRRAAELALARAGGPAPRHPVAAAAIDAPTAIQGSRPTLVRSGRAVQTLITRPHVGAVVPRQDSGAPMPGRAPAGAGSLLPTYLASPIDAVGRRWKEWRRP